MKTHRYIYPISFHLERNHCICYLCILYREDLLRSKNWSPEFKAKSIVFFGDVHDAPVECSDHGVARAMGRANKVILRTQEIINACTKKPQYIQNDGRFVYYVGDSIYVIQSPKTGDFVTCVKRNSMGLDWINLEEGGK